MFLGCAWGGSLAAAAYLLPLLALWFVLFYAYVSNGEPQWMSTVGLVGYAVGMGGLPVAVTGGCVVGSKVAGKWWESRRR
jgi:hypothetical protein